MLWARKLLAAKSTSTARQGSSPPGYGTNHWPPEDTGLSPPKSDVALTSAASTSLGADQGTEGTLEWLSKPTVVNTTVIANKQAMDDTFIMRFKDSTGGFKCFRRSTLEMLPLDSIKSDGYSFQIEMNYHCWKRGLRIKEIPIMFVDRQVGVSKMSRRIIVEAALMVWALRFKKIP